MNYSDLRSFQLLGADYGCSYHRASHLPTKQVYVLKRFSSDCISFNGPEINQQIEIFGHVDHPNVMKFLDRFDLGYNQIELLLEFFDGEPLDKSCITDEQLLSKIAKQILRGLSYLHKHGIAHNGIKPLSLFMDSRHKVKITDFVASKFTEGSVAYMSPDSITGKIKLNDDLNYECSRDVWSFGMTMLEIFMGKFPLSVEKNDWASLMLAILKSPPPEAPPTASGEFRDFIGCCLQKKSTRRWTAEQLLQHPFLLRRETSDDDENDEVITVQNSIVDT